MRAPRWLALAALLSAPVAVLAAPEGSPAPSPEGYVPRVVEVADPLEIRIPGIPSWGDLSAAPPLTPEEAAWIALDRYFEVAQARSGLEAARGRARAVSSAALPQVRVSGGYTENLLAGPAFLGGGAGGAGAGGGIGFGAFNGAIVSSGASLSQLLFDFGQTRSRVSQAQAQVEAWDAELRRARADVVLQAKRSFYQALQADQLVEVALKNLANQREHLGQARGRFQSGIGLPADVTRAETAVSQAAFELTRARAQAQLARVDLAVLMGVDPRTPFALASRPERELDLGQPERLFERALAARPELLRAEAEVGAGRSSVEVARTSNEPSLTGGLNYGRTWLGGGSFENLLLNFSLQWQAWDGGATAGRVQEARAQLDAAVAARDGARQRVLAEVLRAWLNLQAAHQGLISARAQEANAQETVRLASGRYGAGLGIFLDVLDAQGALVRAEVNRVQAELAIELARLALNHAVGEPLADQGRSARALPGPVRPEAAPGGGPQP